MKVDRNHTARCSNRTQTTTLLLCLLFREDRIATADAHGFRAHRSRGSLLRTAPSSGCLPLPSKGLLNVLMSIHQPNEVFAPKPCALGSSGLNCPDRIT